MAENQPIISIRGVSKRFGAVVAVDDVSLDIAQNEFFALLGPSGCGKTTLLRMLAGFETPSAGQILIDGQDMSRVPPNRRPVNMVFQSYAVFPHMPVAQNVAYGLKVAGVPGGEQAGRVEEALELVKLAGYGGRKPDQLSGGQRQRVALARALVKRPKVLLLDEPLSALDAKLREAMQLELVNLRNTVGITFIIVTHDQNEALSMANRIAVMENGKVRQIDSPALLYEYPNCRFVADFIGKMNLFAGRVSAVEADRLRVEVTGIGAFDLPVPDDPKAQRSGVEIGIAVRPEKIRVAREAPPDGGRVALHGKVSQVAYYGDISNVFVTLDSGQTISATLQNDVREAGPRMEIGEGLWCYWNPSDTLLLTA